MHNLQFFAGIFDPDTIWIFIPLGGMGLGLIGMFMAHQQKMAQILHTRLTGGVAETEIESLRMEVRELRAVMDQAIRGGIFNREPLPPIEVAPALRVGE